MAHPDFPEARLRALIVSTRLSAISNALLALTWVAGAAVWVCSASATPPPNGAFLAMAALIVAALIVEASAEGIRRKNRLAFRVAQAPSWRTEFYLTLGAVLLAIVTGVAGTVLHLRALELASDLLMAGLVLLWAADHAQRSWFSFRLASSIVPLIDDQAREELRYGCGQTWSWQWDVTVNGRVALARAIGAMLHDDPSHPRYLDWIPSEVPATERTPA